LTSTRPPGRSQATERRRDVFASTQFIDIGERRSAFGLLLLLMILLSILGIVAQAAFA
jgi:hypothetical protein